MGGEDGGVMDAWIPIVDSKPEYQDWVLVVYIDAGHRFIDFAECLGDRFETGGGFVIKTATHWMPLPAMPEDGV
jgi:hypothetical protein